MKKFAKFMTALCTAIFTASSSVITAFADDVETATDATTQTGNVFYTLILPLILMFAILYFMAIRPQKKREEEMKAMQNSIEIGDEVVTSGGIVGIVVRRGEDTVLIETGGERNKIRIKTWAISENVTATERAKAAAPKKADTPLAAAGLTNDGNDDKKKKKKKTEEDE